MNEITIKFRPLRALAFVAVFTAGFVFGDMIGSFVTMKVWSRTTSELLSAVTGRPGDLSEDLPGIASYWLHKYKVYFDPPQSF